jgi:hypothetical protein
MRTSGAFVLGTVLGAAVMLLWGPQIGEYVQESTRGMRMKAADGVRAVEEKAGKVLDRGGDAPCIGLTTSCRTRRSTSARLSGLVVAGILLALGVLGSLRDIRIR